MKNNRNEKFYIYGRHALVEALRTAPKSVRKVFLASGTNDPEIASLLRENNIQAGNLKQRDVTNKAGADAVHQGVIAMIDPGQVMIDFSVFVKTLKPNEETMLVLLDELTDPHNVGAIIRSAAAFGASGVLIPEHNQAPLTGAVVKVSAGMAFRVPIISIGNINFTIDSLKKIGFRVYGLAMSGSHFARDEKFSEPALFIVGNEGRGIRQKTMGRCDATLRIPMHPRTESLNASVSAALILYEWSVKHAGALK